VPPAVSGDSSVNPASSGWRRVAGAVGARLHRDPRSARVGPGQLAPLRSTRRSDADWRIAVLVFQGVTSAEIDEPVRRMADRLRADVVHVGIGDGHVHGVEPARFVEIDVAPSDAPPADVVVIPGGIGWERLVADSVVMTWLSATAQVARGVLAISTGSLLLASAGRLDGQNSTGHWLAQRDLARLGATVQSERVVRSEDGRIVTASGANAAFAAVDELLDRVMWDAP